MEIQRLGPVFLQSAHWLWQQRPELHFVVAAATPLLADELHAQHRALFDALPLTIITANTRKVLETAQVALVASGTATLEALLLACPQVVAYKVSPLTAWIARRLVDLRYFSLPNLVAGDALVEEFFQQQATPEALGAALLRLLEDPGATTELQRRCEGLRATLGGGASERAATAVAALLETTA